MEESKKLPVKLSKEFNLDLDQIYAWGTETFGISQAEFYENEIWKLLEGLHHKNSSSLLLSTSPGFS